MATIYPPLETIKRLKQPPTEGELVLLEWLDKNLSGDFEVYFQPFLIEARPDIVVMRRDGGVIIFEVKDWDLANYESLRNGTWKVKANGELMHETPIRQVVSYKDKLFSLNSATLLNERTVKGNKSCWGLVHCAVFFHKSTEARVNALCKPSDITPKNRKFLSYIGLFGDDSLLSGSLRKFLGKIDGRRYGFTECIYQELRRILKPDFHTMEMGVNYELTKAQEELSKSVAGARKRIRGVAGGGKSFVLARRAVNAHKRTNGNVLILTYNITLKNYLHDRISEVRENFDWRYFHIQNYHQLFNSMLAECNKSIPEIAMAKWPKKYGGYCIEAEEDDVGGKKKMPDLTEVELEAIYSDISIFEGHEADISKYDVVLIDEAQDYREEWVRIIMRYKAGLNAEIVAFADEKQNVYSRRVDENRLPVIPVATGQWDRSLKTTYRQCRVIADLAAAYQKHFLEKRYEIDAEIKPAPQMELLFDAPRIEHIFHQSSTIVSLRDIATFIRDTAAAESLHNNDIVILAPGVDFTRELGNAYADLTGEEINTMCEAKIVHDEIVNRYNSPNPKDRQYWEMKRDIEKVRRFKKVSFRQNRGSVSFSSILSFKGLESPAVFLIVGTDNSKTEDGTPILFAEEELMYVGITRARNKLFVLNFGDAQYETFFTLPEVRKLNDEFQSTIGDVAGATLDHIKAITAT